MNVSEQEISNGYFTKKVWLNYYDIPKVDAESVSYKEIGAIPSDAIPADTLRVQIILGKERKRPFALLRIPAYSIDPTTKISRRIEALRVFITEQIPQSTNSLQAKSTAQSSVLANGTWYKISIPTTGFFKIDANLLASLGISSAGMDLSKIRVFGNGGNMLSENNAVGRPQDLVENPLFVNDVNSNGLLDQEDCAVFYATGPITWSKDSVNSGFTHIPNLYEDKAYYFLNFDQTGIRIQDQVIQETPNVSVNSYDHFDVHEKDLVNPGALGKEWWGEEFSRDPGKTLSQTINIEVGQSLEPVKFKMHFGARTTTGSNNLFNVNINGTTGTANASRSYETPMADGYLELTSAVNGTANVNIIYAPGNNSNKGFLNFIEVNARKPLDMGGKTQITFRDWRSVGLGRIAGYSVNGASNNTQVWDVTDPLLPQRMAGTLNGGTFNFAQNAETLHQFAAFNNFDLPVPTAVGKLDNQNLHGSDQVDYIIVTHPLFWTQANELADFHRQRSGLRVLVASTTQIYNEFSSGGQDISAIRDFVKLFYDRAGNDTTQMPKYLLLFGDASYDYKDRLGFNTNMVPTFESLEFSQAINSFSGDDFFSFLDDNENIEDYSVFNTMDIGVGRFPLSKVEDAIAQVNKIRNYKSPASLGPWKLSVMLAADNADGAGDHDLDAELMGSKIAVNSNIFNFTKVFLDAIPRIATPGGLRAPDANKAINDQILRGTFLLNYSGHGNTQVLAEERIIIQDDYSNWKNFNKLPVIITATCDYGQFDRPEFVSSGEALVLKPDGGAIAMLTTTQLVYASGNRKINSQFLEDQFAFNNGKNYTFGDAIRLAKNMTYQSSTSRADLINFRKFVLLGDPALTPGFPEHNVKVDSITDDATGISADTIKALGAYTITGSVIDDNGQFLDDFNGTAYITIYDKPKRISSITGVNRTYSMLNNVIYKGKVSILNGVFRSKFIAPKDINYDVGTSKISLYAENGSTDGAGADTSIQIGGFSDVPVIENEPPKVRPYIGDSLFIDGGITGANTSLFVILEDETGINISSNTVGHDLTAILDENTQDPYILNDYYETETNTYKRGYVTFPIDGLSNGKHSLRVKAWDVNNNSGEGVVNFEVIDGEIVKINNLMNYPNPFTTTTRFVFEHNHPNEAINVEINIYNTSGVLVSSMQKSFISSGSRSNEVTWDGTNNAGSLLPDGLYVYKLSVTTDSGIKETAYQKLLIMR
jgi:hypothetical protein